MSELNITQQILEDSHELLLKVEVPEDRVNAELRKLAKKLGRRVRIPGFRPGKAPANLIIARLGRENLLEELADDLAEDVFQEAFQQVDKEQIVPGAVLRHVELEPLTYEFVLPLKPEVDPGDYRNLRVPLEPVDEAQVLKMVDEELTQLLDQNKIWKPVERPVAYGDLVTMSLKVMVDEETELDQDEWEFIPDADDPTLSPEFDAAIVGMEPGEKKTFTIDFPEDSSSPWAGKTATFEVEVKSVKAKEQPELTDELVAENTDFKTVEAFKEALEQSAREHLAALAEQDFEKNLFEKLKEGASIRFAPATLANEVQILEQQREDLYKQYGFESTQQLLDLQGKTLEAYRKELEPEAQAQLEKRLLLDAIAKQERFEVMPYELEQYIRDANLDPAQTEELLEMLQSNEGYRNYIRDLVLQEKAFELLKAIAKGEEVPAPGEHPRVEAPTEPEADTESVATEETDDENTSPAEEPEVEESSDETPENEA